MIIRICLVLAEILLKQKLLILNKIYNLEPLQLFKMSNLQSAYLSVLDNQWSPFTTHSYNHDLDQKNVCELYQQLPGITQLKETHPQINVQIRSHQIKPLKNGIYIGQFNQEGKPQGYGMIRYEDNSIVQAHFRDGKANGKGYKWFGENWYYVGDFVDNNLDGRGQYQSPQISYIGQFSNNTFHGQGELTITKNKGVFNGLMQNGSMKQGKLTWQATNPKFGKQILKFEYIGTFQNGQFDGQNCQLTSNIGVYKGGFKNGKKSGPGRFQFSQKYQYIGNYENNLKSGFGALYNPQIKSGQEEEIPELSQLEKNISYRGSFENNLPHGKGQIFKEVQKKLVSAQYIEGIWTEALKGVTD